MTIKEIEERSGMTRANIRFYESEGLLRPERRDNNYREYSEEDLETLLRIKLLRALGVSLEDIKALQGGAAVLDDTLAHRLEALEREQSELEKSGAVCREMRADRVSYPTLDARRYLEALEGRDTPVSPPAGDAVPRVQSPWRRYFARMLDLSLCSLPGEIFLTFQRAPSLWGNGYRFLIGLAGLIVMVLAEPLFLHWFGATPGKWLLGLSVVSDATGGRPSYGEAQERTLNVLWHGMGFNIPIYNLVRLWKSKQACEEGNCLDWEDATSLVLEDRVWNIPAYIGARAALLGVSALAVLLAQLPRHRGDISVAEFCDNYNRYQSYYSASAPVYILDGDGTWTTPGVVISGGLERPRYVFTEENGVMTGVSFSVEVNDGSTIFSGEEDQATLCVLAFVRAQPGSDFWGRDTRQVLRYMDDHPQESFRFTVNGVDIDCRVDYEGYTVTGNGWLFPTPGNGMARYSYRFELRKG